MATDILRFRGDTYPVELTLDSGATGSTFVLTVARKPYPADDTAKVFSAVGAVQSDTVVSFPISADSAAFAGAFYYDIQMTDGSGIVYTVANGAYTVKQDVTK